MREQIKATVRRHILSAYLPGETEDNLRDETALRTSGVLDSMATLGLVSFLEKEFGIEIEAGETGIDNFDRVDDIAAFVERKLAASER